MGRALIVASAMLCFLMAASSVKINVADGGYEDILVSVSKAIPYNESIVENIKALFVSSSEFLHQATHGRVYFKKVIIELPHTWPKRPSAQAIYASTFKKSDVRVDIAPTGCGDDPFTKQMQQCGLPGEFIQLTPGFLAQTQNTAASSKVHAAYVFVHEWAHFRYGVFDEYGSPHDSTYPAVFCRGRKVFANICSRRFPFTGTNSAGSRCSANHKCRIVGYCKLTISKPTGRPIDSSIMFMPYIANVSQFCDNNHELRLHNALAPNMQNEICNQRPAWEVISRNDDFKSLPKPDMSKRIQVTFQEKQSNNDLGPRVVLVLDVSGSMQNNSRMEFLKMAVNRYINDIEDGSQRLAIVTFSTTAKVHHELMELNASTRQGFLDAVSGLNAAGWTCIGCGLRTALSVLNTSSEKPEGAIIILFTDGLGNRPPHVTDVKSDIKKAKITLNAAVLGVKAEEHLHELSIATKGKAFLFEDLKGNLGLKLESAFVTAATAQVDDGQLGLTVVDTVETFKNKLEKAIVIDGGMANNTTVVIQPNNLLPLKATKWLVDPSGHVCQECKETADGNGAVIAIPSPAKVGTWKLYLETNRQDEMNVTIQVKTRNKGGEPILLTASVVNDSHSKLTVLAQVTKGKHVILNANVYAIATGPKVSGRPHKSTFRLYDDGKEPDVRRNDGVYSGYFVDYLGSGRYSVSAYAGTQPETRLNNCSHGSGSFRTTEVTVSEVPIPGAATEHDIYEFFNIVNTTSEDTDTVEGSHPLDEFVRETHAGDFDVNENIFKEDLPPGNIRDLRVADLKPGSNGTLLVQLTWTWPGAHLTSDIASGVTIRASEDFYQLKSNFDSHTEITNASVVGGNLDPLPPRATHVVTIALPAKFASRQSDGEYAWIAYIAIRVTNRYGRSSNTSNVVEASYTSRRVKTVVTVATESELTVTTKTGKTVASKTELTFTTEIGGTVPTETATPKKDSSDDEDDEDSDEESSAWFLLMWVCVVIVVVAAVFIAIIHIIHRKGIQEETWGTLTKASETKTGTKTVTKSCG